MKPLAAATALAASLLLLTAPAAAQSAPVRLAPLAADPASPDVVRLKDGNVWRGTLTEVVQNHHVALRLPTNQSAIIKWEAIAQIERNGAWVDMNALVIVAAPGAPAAAPGTPPPGAPTTMPVLANLPPTLPFDKRHPDPPAGYHLQTSPRYGYIISGGILTFTGGVILVAFCVETGCNEDLEGLGAFFLSAIFLGPGVPLLLVGLLTENKKWVRDEPGVTPAPAQAAGLRLGTSTWSPSVAVRPELGPGRAQGYRSAPSGGSLELKWTF